MAEVLKVKPPEKQNRQKAKNRKRKAVVTFTFSWLCLPSWLYLRDLLRW
jgi:hypothetical protein